MCFTSAGERPSQHSHFGSFEIMEVEEGHTERVCEKLFIRYTVRVKRYMPDNKRVVLVCQRQNLFKTCTLLGCCCFPGLGEGSARCVSVEVISQGLLELSVALHRGGLLSTCGIGFFPCEYRQISIAAAGLRGLPAGGFPCRPPVWTLRSVLSSSV